MWADPPTPPGAPNSLPRDSNVGYPIDIRKPKVNDWLHRSLRSPKVVADETSSYTTGHHAACTWCSYSSAAVSREVRARGRPRWRARVRCAGGVARPAGAKPRDDDQQHPALARRAEARRARAFEGGGRAAIAPDGEERTALPRLARVDFGPSLLGTKRRQGANDPGRLSGVHAVGGPPGQHARPLLPASRVRSRQDRAGPCGSRSTSQADRQIGEQVLTARDQRLGIDIPLVFLMGSGFERTVPSGHAGRDAIRFTQGPAGRSLRTAPGSRS